MNSTVIQRPIRTDDLIFLQTWIIYLHSAADSVGHSVFNFFLVGSVKRFFRKSAFQPSRSSTAIDFRTNRKRISDFLLVRNSNLGHILHRFRNIARFCVHYPTPIAPYFWGCSRCTRSPMLGWVWTGTLSYSAVKLFSKYSNVCDHGTWTSQTDGRTDRQTTYCDITALWAASRVKKTLFEMKWNNMSLYTKNVDISWSEVVSVNVAGVTLNHLKIGAIWSTVLTQIVNGQFTSISW